MDFTQDINVLERSFKLIYKDFSNTKVDDKMTFELSKKIRSNLPDRLVFDIFNFSVNRLNKTKIFYATLEDRSDNKVKLIDLEIKLVNDDLNKLKINKM